MQSIAYLFKKNRFTFSQTLFLFMNTRQYTSADIKFHICTLKSHSTNNIYLGTSIILDVFFLNALTCHARGNLRTEAIMQLLLIKCNVVRVNCYMMASFECNMIKVKAWGELLPPRPL